MRSAWVLVVCAGLLMVTGCLGGDEGLGEGSSVPEEAIEPQEEGDAWAVASFADEGAGETVWMNGSFATGESCYLSGCATGAYSHQLALGEKLPAGVPVHLEAQLTYETGEGFIGNPILLGLDAEDASVYRMSVHHETGRSVVEALVLGGVGPVTLQVAKNFPSGMEPEETSYELEVALHGDRERVEPGVPVALDLDPGDRISAEPVGEGSVGFVLRGENDEFVGQRFSSGGEATVSVPEGEPSGEYVVILLDSSDPARLQVDGASSSMRALPVMIDMGPLHEVGPYETLEFTYDVQSIPLAVGVYYYETHHVGVGLQPGVLELYAPENPLLVSEFGCQLCMRVVPPEQVPDDLVPDPGPLMTEWSSTAHPHLEEGTYRVVYESTAEAGYGVGALMMTYDRP